MNILNKARGSKHILIALLLSVAVFTSCEDLLTEKPQSVAAETFYNTTAEVESALYAVYQQIKNRNGITGQLGAQLEAYSDYIVNRGSYLVLSDFQGLNSTNIGRTDEGWRLFYLAIRNANLVIANTPNGKSSSTDKARLIAEAKFLRAYCYFWLVRNWNGVPIRTELNIAEPNVKRSTAEEVYTLILADLTDAETNLPAVQRLGGRATSWAAKAALAEVYFTRNQYDLARTKSLEIINGNQFSLEPVATTADFAKLFGPGYSTKKEDIWSLRMVNQAGFGNYLAAFFGAGATRLQGAGNFTAMYTDFQVVSFIKNWDKNDLRYSYSLFAFPLGFGSATTMVFKKVADPAATADDAASNPFHVYRLADILLLFAEADARVNNGPTTAALEALNQVHRRAYGYAASAPSIVDFKLADYNTVAAFTDLVIKERGYETINEAKRWLDLKRLGNTELRARIRAAFNKNVADKHLFWPIPNAEITSNLALDPTKDQNPGY